MKAFYVSARQKRHIVYIFVLYTKSVYISWYSIYLLHEKEDLTCSMETLNRSHQGGYIFQTWNLDH